MPTKHTLKHRLAAVEGDFEPIPPELFLVVPPCTAPDPEAVPDVTLTDDLTAAPRMERRVRPRSEGLELLTRADAASFRERLRAALADRLGPAPTVTVDDYLSFLGARCDPDRDPDAATYFDALDAADVAAIWRATVREAPHDPPYETYP